MYIHGEKFQTITMKQLSVEQSLRKNFGEPIHEFHLGKK